MQDTYDVVVVGAGPVGVGLALDLGLRGLRCALVERRVGLSDIPKGQDLTCRSLEHFRYWGAVDELRAARVMPLDQPIGTVTVYRDLQSGIWHAPPGRESVRRYHYEDNERLPQYRTEEVLRRRLEQIPTVDVFWGWTVTEVEQDDDGVQVVAERDGESMMLGAPFAVGCDGGRSKVRESTSITRSGTDFDRVMALVVFRSRELHAMLEQFPPRSTYRVMHPDLQGYWLFFGRIDVGESFFFHAPIAPDATVDDVEQLLHRAAGRPFECTIDRVGFWDLRVEVAESYRDRRLLIAGDAAHTHPPYGGFGLNNGLEDAVNLGWKLAAVLEGWGGPGLLDSYSLERRAVFHDIAEGVIASGIDRDRLFLAKYTPEDTPVEFERGFVETVSTSWGRGRAPHYEGSPVVVGAEGSVSSADGTFTLTARPGHHLPPHGLSDGRSVADALGRGFTLLALDATDDADAFVHAAAAAGVPLTVVSDSYDGGREQYGAKLVLVRPDQHVAWVGDEKPEDLAALLSVVTGH